MEQQIEQFISEQLKHYPFEVRWGHTRLTTPLSIGLYTEWLKQNEFGQMTYLSDHLDQKVQPQNLMRDAKSALVFAVQYTPHHPQPQSNLPLSFTGIAKYAQGADYHFWLTELLTKLAKTLQSKFPTEEFRVFSDKYPILERDLAYRAGLGWIGKNSCLIDKKKGSFSLLGEIFTTLDLNPKAQFSADHCGNCQRCIEACPTSAIASNRTLKADRCISYWTIESSEIPPEELRLKFGEWIFGCDICQDVCPWNKPLTAKNETPDFQKFKEDLKWILQSSSKTLQKQFKGTALSRAAGNKLKRNAMIAIANLKISELDFCVQLYVDHPKLGYLAKKVLSSIKIS